VTRKTHYFDMKKDPDNKRPLPNRLFRSNDDGDLFYNGQKCREFAAEDYDAPGRPKRERLRSPSVSPPVPELPVPTTICVVVTG
jgi:hypothetical protein